MIPDVIHSYFKAVVVRENAVLERHTGAHQPISLLLQKPYLVTLRVYERRMLNELLLVQLLRCFEVCLCSGYFVFEHLDCIGLLCRQKLCLVVHFLALCVVPLHFRYLLSVLQDFHVQVRCLSLQLLQALLFIVEECLLCHELSSAVRADGLLFRLAQTREVSLGARIDPGLTDALLLPRVYGICCFELRLLVQFWISLHWVR